MPVIRIPLSYLWSFCHILVIAKLENDIPGIYQSVPNLKKICQTSKRCTRYIKCTFSGSELQVPVICLAYLCHNFFRFRGMRPANEIQQVIESQFHFSIPQHGVHEANKIYLPPVRPLAPLPSFGGVASLGPPHWRPLAQGQPVQGATKDRCD